MIPEAAVEAAAKAWHLSRWADAPWEMLNDDSRAYSRTHARAALEAAAPHMLAEAWEAGEEAGQDNADSNRGHDVEHRSNPYRPTP